MTSSDLPENLNRFIQYCLPTFSAAEILVYLARHPAEAHSAQTIVGALQHRGMMVSTSEEYLARFLSLGLVARQRPGFYMFRPKSRELDEAVKALVVAFNERSVTLIRTIYLLTDHPLPSFADTLRPKPD